MQNCLPSTSSIAKRNNFEIWSVNCFCKKTCKVSMLFCGYFLKKYKIWSVSFRSVDWPWLLINIWRKNLYWPFLHLDAVININMQRNKCWSETTWEHSDNLMKCKNWKIMTKKKRIFHEYHKEWNIIIAFEKAIKYQDCNFNHSVPIDDKWIAKWIV